MPVFSLHLRGNKEKWERTCVQFMLNGRSSLNPFVEETPSGASSTTQAIVYMVYIYLVKPQYKNPTLNFPAVSPGRFLTGLQRLGFFGTKIQP